MNAYEILECNRDILPDDLKKHYQKLLLKYHPDKCLNDSNQELVNNRFIQLHTAFSIISEPTKRAKYDSILKQSELEREKCSDNVFSFYSLKTDFSFDYQQNTYFRECRCGDSYLISLSCLNNLLENNSEDLIVSIECSTCSLSINVLII